jgi:CBS domain-containing protein
MTAAGCSALLVDLRDGSHGIVTERDIVRGLADGADADTVWATDVLTRDLLEIDAEDSIGDAAELMMEAGVRHLAVVDSDDGRVGIVSMRDLINPLLDSVDG